VSEPSQPIVEKKIVEKKGRFAVSKPAGVESADVTQPNTPQPEDAKPVLQIGRFQVTKAADTDMTSDKRYQKYLAEAQQRLAAGLYAVLYHCVDLT